MTKEEQDTRIKELCDELAMLFGGNGRVTILVRHPTKPEKGCLVSEEYDLTQIIPAIQRFMFRQ